MKNITRINHLGLRVKDLTRTRIFYEQFGFIFIAGPLGPEPVAVMEHPSGININLILNGVGSEDKNILMDIPKKHTGFTHVALEVESADVLLEALSDLHIPLSGEPMNHPTGTSFFIRDPDRNVIEFIEYKGLQALQSMNQG